MDAGAPKKGAPAFAYGRKGDGAECLYEEVKDSEKPSVSYEILAARRGPS